ncbi:MobF family relaxase [Rhodopirellula bahusiensis]
MRITHSKNAGSAKRYFELSDYLESDPNALLKGRWFGKAARLLGLEGEVDKAIFDRLVDNQMPFEEGRITQRQREDRRVGTDLTFSAPKSLSLLWAMTQDDEILQAMQNAAHETLADLEQDAQTRVNHSRGVMSLAKTRNIVGASWLHTTSRPVDGYPDPNLHVHAFTLNMTHADDRWTALDLSAVVKDSGFYEAVFQSRLAQHVQEIGYPVERSERGFEIAGITRPTIEKFSRRTALIEAEAEKRGITDADEKGRLGAQTRDKKASNTVPAAELPVKWKSLLSPEERRQFQQLAGKEILPAKEKTSASQAADFAIEHCFERDSVVRERQLMRHAILRAIGVASPNEMCHEVQSRPLIRSGEEEKTLVTTREILGDERAMLSFARRGKGEYDPLASQHQIKRAWLSDEQKEVIHGVLNSHDRVAIIRGVAGSGKTTVMQETIEAIENGGKHVTVLAPMAQTAHDVLGKQEGLDAHTLARFLVDKQMQEESREGVIWVDEGALIGTRDLTRLTRLADRLDSRLILSGDGKQHQPVTAGSPFRLLEKQAGIKPLEIQTIRRQEKEDYRQAVTLLSQGDAAAGLQKLSEIGFVQEIDDDEERYRAMARDYADSVSSKAATLLIAPTHAERELATQAARTELKSRGMIDQVDHSVETLQSKRLTKAQRGDPRNYEAGNVVEFITKGKGGFRPGDRIEVTSVSEKAVNGVAWGRHVEIPLDSPGTFELYRKTERGFAAGDVIRITKNRKASKDKSQKRLNNGGLMTIDGFTEDGDLKLSDGQVLAKQWAHFDHGISITSHASQGMTVDRVIVAQSSLSAPASSPEQLYVSASRAKRGMTIYTDRAADLLASVSSQRLSMNASDLVAENSFAATGPMPSRLKQQAERLRLAASRFASRGIDHLKELLIDQHRANEVAR